MSRLTPRVFWALVALAIAAIAFAPKHEVQAPVNPQSQPTTPAVTTAAPPGGKASPGGMCDHPPFGVTHNYEDLAEIFGAGAVLSP
jgi:hypothetical protein